MEETKKPILQYIDGMHIPSNQPIEINETQCKKLAIEAAGIIAYREEAGRFYFQLWMPKYRNLVSSILEKYK